MEGRSKGQMRHDRATDCHPAAICLGNPNGQRDADSLITAQGEPVSLARTLNTALGLP